MSRRSDVADFLNDRPSGRDRASGSDSIEVGEVSRIRSKAAFAVMSGTAPLIASSGQTNRHRLSRGGNRQLNRALHFVAFIHSRSTPEAKEYLARHRAAGKSPKESMRCLKPHLSNVVYRRLVADAGIEMAA